MKKLSGFSLMEMMVVLLIVSIVAAASAPMVNKKMLNSAAEKSPWVWTGNGMNIAYNLAPDTRTVSIGTINPPASASNARLYLDTKLNNENYIPQIAFGQNNGNNVMKLISANRNVWFSTADSKFNNIQNTVVIGPNSSSNYSNTVVIGNGSSANSSDSIAIGDSVTLSSSSNNSIAIGTSANAAKNSTALGYGANASKDDSTALGYNATASGNYSSALGYNATTSGNYSSALGYYATASNDYSTALGERANAIGNYSSALGYYANASGTNSTALGRGVKASGNYSSALGYYANVTGTNSTALGYEAKAFGNNSSALGYNANASGDNSTALGYYAKSLHANSVAIGHNAQTTKGNQIVLGTADDTVYVPGALQFDSLHLTGDLVVDGWAVLARNSSSKVILRLEPGPPDEDSKYSTSEMGYIYMGDDKGGDDNTRTLRKYNWTANVLGFEITSDRRLKNVGKAFVGGLDKIKKLEVFNYTLKDDKTKTPRVGVIAQDLQKIFPDAVMKGEDGFLRIRLEDMFYALVNAVKELDSKIELLKNQDVAELKTKVTKLEKENAELKKQNKEFAKQNQEFAKRLSSLENKIK